MQQVDWLTNTEKGLEFLKTMSESDDCQILFTSKALQDVVNNLWRISRTFFVYSYFLAFAGLNFFPLLVMAVMIDAMEVNEGAVFRVIYYIAALAFLIGTIVNFWTEVKEFKDTKGTQYFRSIENYFQVFLNIWNIVLVLKIVFRSPFLTTIEEQLESEEKEDIDRLRVCMILAILLNVVELFSRIRVFDFFAYFVRQIQEITIDALPLGAMLFFIVLA